MLLKKICMISFFSTVYIFICLMPEAYSAEKAYEMRGPVFLTDATTFVTLGRSLHIIEDPEGMLTPEDIILQSGLTRPIEDAGDIPNFGFKRSFFWVVFTVDSKSINTEWVLELVHPLMDSIKLYLSDSYGIKLAAHTGLLRPFSTREELHRNFIFFLKIKKGERKTVIMRLRNDDRMEIHLNLWSKVQFYKKDRGDQLILGIFSGFVLLIIIFHLFLYFNMRETIYIAYVPFVFLLGFFILMQAGIVQQYLWPNFLSEYLRFTPILIGLLLLAAFIFLIGFLDLKQLSPVTYKIVRAAAVISMAVALSRFIFGYRIGVILAVGWTICSVLIALLIGINSLKAGSRSARYYMLSWGGMFLGGFVYALKAFGVLPSNPLTTNALHIGSLIQFVVLSFGIGDRIRLLNIDRENAQRSTIESQTLLNKEIEALNFELRKKLTDLDSANKKIGLSEERYRFLVEGTDEIIFSLDESLIFISVNRAVSKQFGITPQEIIGKNFFEIIYEREGEKAVGREIVRDKLNELLISKKPVKFRAEFLSSRINEPREMQIRLEFLDIEGKNEILGKASPVQDDFLMKNFVSESQRHIIGNYIQTADEITRRLTRNLIKYFDKKDIAMIRLALREIVINAIEHGNLEVTYEDKTRATIEGNYLEFLSERQNNLGFTGRTVTIDYSINEKLLCYTVKDQGKGFDYNRYMSEMSGMANEKLLPHGRGLLMTSSIFDKVTFSDTGNTVTLVKYIIDPDNPVSRS